jgi:uncharacterized protein (DUF1800 family)
VTATFLIGAVSVFGDTKTKAKLNQNQTIIHVLNRTGFGPRPGDIERIKKLGIDKYIDQQLHPERIDDSATEARITGLETLRMSIAQLNEKYPNPAFVARELGLRPVGQNGQPRPGEQPPEPESRDQQREYRQKLMAYYSEHNLKQPALILAELQSQKLIRAVYSERQLQEVMADFWFNHFNVFWAKGADKWLTTSYEMSVIRPNTLGKFKDLVTATAKSPAMLFYLDNFQSSSPDMKIPAGTRFNPRRPQQLDRLQRRQQQDRMELSPEQQQRLAQLQNRKPGINENYARELMELHTLGVDGGYTQKDVQEVARCFTGWSIERPQQGHRFVFRPIMHDDKEKIVLGHKIPAGGGMKDGELVIEILTHHPSTARFIATKLVRKFVSDDPPRVLVDRVAAVYTKTDGDIREMLKTIFASPEFNSTDAYRAKIKSPFELAASAIRALGGNTNGSPRLGQFVGKMGQPLYQYQPPTGYPDKGEQWVNTGALLERLNFGIAISSNRVPGTTVDLKNLLSGLDSTRPAKVMDRAIETLLAGNVSPQTRSILDKQLKEGVPVRGELGETTPPDDSITGDSMMSRDGSGFRPAQKSARQETRAIRQWDNRNPQVAAPPPVDPEIAKVFGLVLGSPDFQRR